MVLSNALSSTTRRLVLLIFLFLSADPLYSQSFNRPFSVAHQANLSSENTISDGTLHIVAVMAEFQPDTNRFTSGDGTFDENSIPYLQNESITINPLPHNKTYFEGHLEFAKNYFSRMSGGALDINYHILDDIYRLPEEMKAYSPIGEDPAPDPLADLARDAWEQVAGTGNLGLNLNSNDRIAFVLFHAGVGRDIELTGTTLEKTPQDIPSVYISRDAFSRLFDDPSFSGFPIDNGNLLVDNTLILPRTLTRVGEDITGQEVILQLSTNGMVTAQIGSHIGLPDLFNTETGESGIGRFGLMDGAGIFAYNGLFPPELSAWEKVHMGWADPFQVDYNLEDEIPLPAASLRQNNSIAKIPLSGGEYFLVENRHREASETGTTLTIRKPDGTEQTQTFTNADTSFVFQQSDFSEDLIPGVVIDVSNYDFALPGGPAEVLEETDGNDERILNGGILIWHIDEGIIERQLSNGDGINDNPARRGVNLVEADGAQDIGRPTAIGFFQNEINGSAFDFWWSGNDASVITPTQTISLYENRFAPDTTPNNDSNSGAKSAFELFDFSANLPVANVKIQPFNTGGDLYEIIENTRLGSFGFSTTADDPYWSRYPLSIAALTQDRESESLIPSRNGVFYRFSQGDLIGLFSTTYPPQQPLVTPDENIFVLAPNPALHDQDFTVEFIERDPPSFSTFWEFEMEPNRGLISSPSLNFLQFDGTDNRVTIRTETVEENFYASAGHFSEQINGFESFISNDGQITITTPSGTSTAQTNISDDPYLRKHIGLIEQENGDFKTFLFLQNELYLFEESDGSLNRSTIHDSENIEWPALADIDGSGTIDFIFIDRNQNQIVAKNQNGALVSRFPIDAPRNILFKGTPLIADIDGNGEQEIIVVGQNSGSMILYAYRNDGTVVEEFPLLVGALTDQGDDPVHPAIGGEFLTAVSHNGDLRIWRFPNMGDVMWRSKYGNSGNNKLTGRLLTAPVATPDFGILNTAETYNWPNPAAEETYLRFQTSAAGEVQIRIATTSGRLIYNQTHHSRGGMPEEILINTSDWGSGGYIAVVEATVEGETERKLVKIAVAR